MSNINNTSNINGTNKINGTDNAGNTIRTGLVLEGGGMRGMYTDGILDVFMDQGLFFDGVIGVSAGTIHGSSFVSGQKGRNIRYYKKYIRDNRFISMRNLIKTGDIAEVKFCYHDLPEQLDLYDYDAFNRSKTEFYAVCSNVETGEPEYIRITDMKKQIDVIRASASLPYVSRLVETEGMKLLDGGCTDSIPLMKFREMGFAKNVVILTRPKGYQKEPEQLAMAKIRYRKYPAFVEALSHRHERYNETLKQIDELEKKGEIFVMRPDKPLEIGRLERSPEKLQQVYDLGRRDALMKMRDLKHWLEGKH